MTANTESLVCITTSAAFGGAETSLLTMLTALRTLEPGWRVTVVTPGRGPLAETCRGLGFEVVELPFPAALAQLGETAAVGARSAIAARFQFARQGLGVAAALPGYLRSSVPSCAPRAPPSCTPTVSRRTSRRRWSGRRRFAWCGTCTTTCAAGQCRCGCCVRWSGGPPASSQTRTACCADARAAFGPAAPLTRIYNAVDGRRFSPDGPTLPLAERSGLPPDDGLVRIGLVATFARWKGHEVFLDAVQRLASRFPIRAYVIGGAVYETAGSQWSRDELEKMAKARGLSTTVGFTGHTDDVPAALRSLDIVVHASTEPEPFGMVIAEGMAAGRAVVAARGGGAAELFDDGADGARLCAR